MPIISSRFAIPASLAAVLLTGCDIQVGGNQGLSFDLAQGKATDEWVRTYTLPPNGILEIVTVNGGIDAQPASGREVEVRVERTARAASEEEARKLLEGLDMGEEVEATRVKIEARNEGGDSRGPFGRNRRVNLRYRVLIPTGLTVSFKTGNGSIRMEELNGRVMAETVNGSVTGERLSGGVKASAINGGLRIEMASVTADVEVSTTNGGVRLELPADVKATLDATCVNGGISLDDSLRMQATETSRRRVSGTFNGGGVRIAASTINGGIRIRARGGPSSD